jgi:hypothetical protein
MQQSCTMMGRAGAGNIYQLRTSKHDFSSMLPLVVADRLGPHTTSSLLPPMASNTNAASQNWTNIVSFWKPYGVPEFLATSAHFFVGIMEDGRTVLKYPHRSTPDRMTLESRACLREEADCYARLGFHENLVT